MGLSPLRLFWLSTFCYILCFSCFSESSMFLMLLFHGEVTWKISFCVFLSKTIWISWKLVHKQVMLSKIIPSNKTEVFWEVIVLWHDTSASIRTKTLNNNNNNNNNINYNSKPRRKIHYLCHFSRSFVDFCSHYQVLMYENAYKDKLNNFLTAI